MRTATVSFGMARTAIWWGVAVALVVSGCAPRVSLRQVQEYEIAVNLAERQGMNVEQERAKLNTMIRRYLDKPGEDPALAAERAMGQGQAMMGGAALYQAFKPAPYVPPMSPGEFRRGR